MKNKLLIFIIVILIIVTLLIKNDNQINKEEIKELVVNLNIDDKIINLSLNDYLIGVVGCEMPASFNNEAIKAQVLASRTFAYNYLNDNEININNKVQCYNNIDTLKEKWNDNFPIYYGKIKNAVLETNNEVITYEDKIIKSYYFAISNGKTQDSLSVFNEELPYLTIIDSSFDENVKTFMKTTTFTYNNFCALLNINPCEIDISNIQRDESNRVTTLLINNKKYDAITLRKILSLRSTDFDIKLKDNIEITTRGYGHGVGMSQYGANYLANNNYTYKDIIKYYYKNVEIKNYNV